MKKYAIFSLANQRRNFGHMIVINSSPIQQVETKIVELEMLVDVLYDTHEQAEAKINELPIGFYMVMPVYVSVPVG